VAVNDAALVFGLDPRQYRPHALHAFERDFRETNCYADVFIEVLHALGLEPAACLAFTLASDFEGDQWTLFKPPHADLERLYGLRVEELSLWRPLVDHMRVQLARKRLPLIEVDAYHLPDTAASDYRRQHVKTTIAITHLDAAARRLHYFHNAGFYELEGDDFDGLFRIGVASPSECLPPYCEIIKPDRTRGRDLAELRAVSRELAGRHLALRPRENPVRAHAASLDEHLQWIVQGGEPTYHAYCFATLRQLGANFELAAAFLRWLGDDAALAEAADAFASISRVSKMLILKLARIAATRRVGSHAGSFEEMAQAWEAGMSRLAGGLAREA
jgi:hypothetical protein